jgi:hypothetical protein
MFCRASKYQEVHVFAEICMPHAMQIRQTGGPEVLNWTAVDVDVAADMQSATAGYRGKFLTPLGNIGIQS